MPLQKIAKAYLELFMFSGAVVFMDQMSKIWVRTNLSYGEIWPQNHWISHYAQVVYVTNTGAALGAFQGLGWLFFAGLLFLQSGCGDGIETNKKRVLKTEIFV